MTAPKVCIARLWTHAVRVTGLVRLQPHPPPDDHNAAVRRGRLDNPLPAIRRHRERPLVRHEVDPGVVIDADAETIPIGTAGPAA